MAKKSNPLLQALKSRSGKQEESPMMKMAVIQPKQMVTIATSDVPSLKDAKPGDSVSVYLEGVIHSLNKDGKAEVEINKFSDEQNENETEPMQEEPPMVQPSVTPVPGAV